MSVKQAGSNILVSASVAGSIFPTNEKDAVFPVLIDGTKEFVHVEGAVYGRAVELRGQVRVDGPLVSRQDLTVAPRGQRVQLQSGVTINGSLVTKLEPAECVLMDSVQDARLIIKGDITVNQNVSLRNALVFGSVRAVNCTLDNTVVLGTCIVEESLTLRMSSVGGYAARDVSFEGCCLMINALGESNTQPRFMAYEAPDGRVLPCDIRYYPTIRSFDHLFNRSHAEGVRYPAYSALLEATDWVNLAVSPNPALNEAQAEALNKWALSIGGRVGDIGVIASAIDAMTHMLKCGFEYEHYHPQRRRHHLDQALGGLTSQEAWALQAVCL